MRIVVDMNLSPRWAVHLRALGHEASHWSEVGDHRAPDSEVLAWASVRGHAVLTHDLDFADLLARTQARAPSVVQLRCIQPRPGSLALLLGWAMDRHAEELRSGAVLSIDRRGTRVRMLPLPVLGPRPPSH